MGKTAWMVIAAIMSAAFLLAAGAAWNNKKSLEAANAQLRETRTTDYDCSPSIRTLPPVQAAQTDYETTDGNDEYRCIGGQRFRRLNNGWEQVGNC